MKGDAGLTIVIILLVILIVIALIGFGLITVGVNIPWK